MKLGASKHWKEALKAITGESEMAADALLEYFEPLRKFLTTENKRLAKEDEVRQLLEQYNIEASRQCNKVQIADWDKTTDQNSDEKQKAYTRAIAENAEFTKDQFNRHFANLKLDDFPDEKVRRQIKLIGDFGANILNQTELNELTDTISEMVKIYNNATFCKYDNPNCSKRLTLDPGACLYLSIYFDSSAGLIYRITSFNTVHAELSIRCQ